MVRLGRSSSLVRTLRSHRRGRRSESGPAHFVAAATYSGFLLLVVLLWSGSVVCIVRSFQSYREDPEDDVVLRTAKDGGADYIVSGDRHLLSLGAFKGTKITTIDEILKLL
jgi:predicted nucleic acid-binding protein